MTAKQIGLLRQAMGMLEDMPCGGVGEYGDTIAQLIEQAGGEIEDASHWTAQYAWRLLERLWLSEDEVKP